MASRNPSTMSNEHALLNMIKVFFSELEIDLKDLKNPTPQFVTNFYVAFLTELGVNISNVFQIQLEQMTRISHVDMYNQTIPQLNIYHAVNYFAKNIGINDFSFNDIMNPDPKRTVLHLSAMMQFLEYCDAAVHKISPSIEQLVAQQKKKGELLSKIETLKRDINQRATNRVKRAEVMKELEKAIEEEKQKLDELVKEKEVQKQVMENVKKLMLEDEEKETRLIRIVKESEEEVEKLKNMIVKSPEKLKNELKQLQEKKQECDETVQSVKCKYEEKKKLTNLFVADRNKQETRFQKLQELLELGKSAEKMREQLNELKTKQTEHSENIENVEIQISNLSQKLTKLKNNFEDLKLRKSKQDLESKESVETLRNELKVLMANREEESAHAIQVQKQIQEIREKEKALKADLEMFDDYLWREYQNLCAKHQEIRDRYDKILEAAKRRNQRLLEDDGDL